MVLALLAVAIHAAADPVFELTPQSEAVRSGDLIEVRGRAGPGPVEVRWDSAAGEVVGRGVAAGMHQPPFSVTVRIPEASPGVHNLVLVAEGRPVARSPVEVLGASAPFPSPPARGIRGAGVRPRRSPGWAPAAVAAGAVLAAVIVAAVRRRT